jgi:MoaD family protein
MSIELNIPPSFQHITNNARTINVNGDTVGKCLDDLIGRYPPLKAEIFNQRGKLRKELIIFINGENAYPGELEKPVKDGDKVYITYPILGG